MDGSELHPQEADYNRKRAAFEDTIGEYHTLNSPFVSVVPPFSEQVIAEATCPPLPVSLQAVNGTRATQGRDEL